MKNQILGIVNRNADATLLHNNANKDSKRIPVMRDMVAGEVAKNLALEELLPEHIAHAHNTGLIHYHDLDYAPLFPQFNCMLIDVGGMLKNGFRMGNADIDRPRSISTACAITAQIIAQVASHIYGGNTVDRIDEVLAPYVRKSYEKHLAIGKRWCKETDRAVAYATKMTEKETYDAFQGLEYEINTLHTANGQTPFTTLGFGLGTSWESVMIQKAILTVRLNGLGKQKRTAVFPKLVFGVRDGVNLKEGDCNYDVKQLAIKCASERMYPDILNYDRLVEVTGGYKAPMGCRSFLPAWWNEEGEEIYAGRNNLGVVTLNIPRIAMLAERNQEEFWNLLDEAAEVAVAALMTRIERFQGVTADVAPILYMEGACGVRLKAKDPVLPIFQNGRASISLGYIGLHEAANAMFGIDEHTFDSEKKKKFCLDIVKVLSSYVKAWKEATGYGFSLYATPSESLCDRFCRLDTSVFGEVAGVTDKGYYTNSFHLDVLKDVNPYDKIDFEREYPSFSTGGFICYGEYPNMQRNLQALEDVWNYSYKQVPYYGTNTPIDECFDCGYSGEFKCTSKGFTCPSCGNHDPERVSVTRRVCGYLGAPNSRPFIEGKQREVMSRVKHVKAK